MQLLGSFKVEDVEPNAPQFDYVSFRPRKAAREKVSVYPKLLPYFDDLCQRFQESPHFFRDQPLTS